MAEAGPATSSGPNSQGVSEYGLHADIGRTLLPPIGGSRRVEAAQPPPEVDKFQKLMEKVMTERIVEAPGEENTAGHIIARREGQMTAKHGIPRISQGVVDKFNAARHNTAIISAMGHPGLDKLVAQEAEAKRKRTARVKELSAHRSSFSNLGAARTGADGESPRSAAPPLSQQASSPDLPNVYVALGQPLPTFRGTSAAPTSVPPAQLQTQGQTSQGQTSARSGISIRHGGGSSTDGQPHSVKVGAGRITSRRAAPNSRWRRRTTTAPKSLRSDDTVIRVGSRVGRILMEFGGHRDWCSVTVMRHSLATILQANVRGWLIRRKWLANPHAVVNNIKASIEAERVKKERHSALKLELERRALTRKQKEKASSVLQMLFPQKSMGTNVVAMAIRRGSSSSDTQQLSASPLARAKWSRLNKNLDLATEQEDPFSQVDSMDGSESDMSDMGLEDMAMVKMRARTPPWQKVEQSQWEGQWAKLNTKPGRGNLDVVWDLADSAARVQAVQERRAERAAASAAAAESRTRRRGAGRGASRSTAADPLQYDPATQPLPAAVVNELLVQRYIDKYTRLGLLDHLPLRTLAEATIQQQQLQQQQQQLLIQQQQLQYFHQPGAGLGTGTGL